MFVVVYDSAAVGTFVVGAGVVAVAAAFDDDAEDAVVVVVAADAVAAGTVAGVVEDCCFQRTTTTTQSNLLLPFRHTSCDRETTVVACAVRGDPFFTLVEDASVCRCRLCRTAPRVGLIR